MSTEVRVYDMEDGHPCVVMVTSGTHDVSRLANLLASGRCEDQNTADYIRKTLSRHRGGRAALKLLKDHGGPDLLVDTSRDEYEYGVKYATEFTTDVMYVWLPTEAEARRVAANLASHGILVRRVVGTPEVSS